MGVVSSEKSVYFLASSRNCSTRAASSAKADSIFFCFCDRGLQRFLLGFVICQQTVKALIGNAPDSKGFIELF